MWVIACCGKLVEDYNGVLRKCARMSKSSSNISMSTYMREMFIASNLPDRGVIVPTVTKDQHN